MSQSPEQKNETVGVIIVHGIGDQKEGDHLEAVVRPLAEGLARKDRRVTVRNPENVKRGEPQAWIMVHSQDSAGGKLSRIGVHEVHWADINEPRSLMKGILFWLWGLSAWNICNQQKLLIEEHSELFKETMALPCFENREPGAMPSKFDRFKLFLVGWLFFIAAPIIVALDFIAKRVFNTTLPATLDTVVSYLSAVRLYTQPRRAGPGMLDSCNEAPRHAIRRRMARVLADVATKKCGQDYDRWYVLAHSQGTVVAFNGLMASGPALAAYLDFERLEKLVNCKLAGEHRGEWDGPSADKITADHYLRPAIPADWGGQNKVVYREKLFEGFRGLLTYGSPLDKFASLWPPTVALNRWAEVFPEKAQWINVWDPTDPVGARLDAFKHDVVFDKKNGSQCTPLTSSPPENGRKPLEPHNIPCKAHFVLLASHVYYLQKAGGRLQPLSQWIGDWLLDEPDAADCGKIKEAVQGQDQLDDEGVVSRTRLMVFWVFLLAILLLALWPLLALWLVDLTFRIEISACSIWTVPGAACGIQLLKGIGISFLVSVLLAGLLGWFGKRWTKSDISYERVVTPTI